MQRAFDHWNFPGIWTLGFGIFCDPSGSQGNCPVQRHSLAIFCRTDGAHFAGLGSSAHKTNLSSANNAPAAQASAFVIQRTPDAEGIEVTKRFELFIIAGNLLGNNAHRFSMK
jgi:hypothetical protein